MADVSITSQGITANRLQLAGKALLGLAEVLNAEGGNPELGAYADDIVALLDSIDTALQMSLARGQIDLQSREYRNWQRLGFGVPNDVAFMAGRDASGAAADIAVQPYGVVQVARDLYIHGEIASAAVAPVGSDIVFDIEKNGVSIYATKPTILAGTNDVVQGRLTSFPGYLPVDSGDRLEFKILQIGSATAGQDVTFSLKATIRPLYDTGAI